MIDMLYQGGGLEAGFDITQPVLKITHVSLRGVMENTSHVLVVGEGAHRLADKLGVEEVEEEWLITDYARWPGLCLFDSVF